MKTNIFKQHAAIAEDKGEAIAFLEIARFMENNGIEKTRAGLSHSIDAATTLNDQGAVFFYSFALNEVHS